MGDKKNKEISRLKEENAELRDENESLWLMLEEMHASDVKNWRKQIMEAIAAAALANALSGDTEIAEA